jgi:hypothetical protein
MGKSNLRAMNGAAQNSRMTLVLRPAGAGDIDAVMALERRPGFERWVGRSDYRPDFAARADNRRGRR